MDLPDSPDLGVGLQPTAQQQHVDEDLAKHETSLTGYLYSVPILVYPQLQMPHGLVVKRWIGLLAPPSWIDNPRHDYITHSLTVIFRDAVTVYTTRPDVRQSMSNLWSIVYDRLASRKPIHSGANFHTMQEVADFMVKAFKQGMASGQYGLTALEEPELNLLRAISRWIWWLDGENHVICIQGAPVVHEQNNDAPAVGNRQPLIAQLPTATMIYQLNEARRRNAASDQGNRNSRKRARVDNGEEDEPSTQISLNITLTASGARTTFSMPQADALQVVAQNNQAQTTSQPQGLGQGQVQPQPQPQPGDQFLAQNQLQSPDAGFPDWQ
ncbi:hypothetical protein F4810DRAFT_726743 [Camillea tinctor]|nr:hypothetical protein F4810DRAFT_726743 [Camillea tinctor]